MLPARSATFHPEKERARKAAEWLSFIITNVAILTPHCAGMN